MTDRTECFRFEVRSEQHLKELASAPLPLGADATEARQSFHRDLYLDTEEESLRRRGITCRLRLSTDDVRTLSLRAGGEEGAPELRVDSSVRSADLREALLEDTSVSRRLKALVDPATLSVQMELEVERLTRMALRDWLGRPRVELHYDDITALREGASRTFHHLCMHRRRGSAEPVRELADALESDQDVRPAPGSARETAETFLRWGRHEETINMEESGEAPAVPAPRETGRIHGRGDGDRAAGTQTIPEFLNPELSLLSFQERVLSLAESDATPLAERLRFLSIVTTNVDEFHMIRMSGLKRAAREQQEEQCDDGFTRPEQLRLINAAVSRIVARQEACWEECRRELEKIDVRIRDWDDLDKSQRAELRETCRDEIKPGLTPMALTLSPGHPLPHLPHLTLALAVVLRPEARDRPQLAEIELPAGGGRFFRVPGEDYHFIPIEEVVRANLDMLYPDGHIEGSYVFRVTRGGDLSLDEDEAEDLLDAVSDAIDRRPHNPAIRLEVERSMPLLVRELLLENLRRELGPEEVELEPADVQETDGLMDLRCLDELKLPDLPELHYPEFEGRVPIDTAVPMFAAIRRRNLLFHHPFDSFESTVCRFIDEAARDPDVTTIKITLYRMGSRSPIAESLLEAARGGKQVVAFVELKARFDEEHNVGWARKLEDAGGHVVVGLVGFKNHAKVCLVVRTENGKPTRYLHAGTGNYNSRSGTQYTDLSIFSADEKLSNDISDLFNVLTGGTRPPQGLSGGSLVSPYQLAEAMIERIDHEASLARAGRPARITAKLNGVTDSEIVRALYRAATDGVEIDLVVRSICTLRPGVPGRSDRIRVVSVVGRFLEHSRIYRFGNDGSPYYYIGSPDLRPRNLRRRVELVVPVNDPDHRAQLDRMLELYLADPTAWELMPDGEFRRRSGDGVSAQATFIREAENGGFQSPEPGAPSQSGRETLPTGFERRRI